MLRYLSVRVCPEVIFRRSLWIITALVSASLSASFLGIELGHRYAGGLADLVDLGQEHNFPTLFSSVQLLGAGSLAFFLGARERVASLRWLWRFLGTGLCWIGIDEAVSIHELGNYLDIGRLSGISYFRFAWVVPGLIVVAGCAGVLWRLLRSLPRETAAMFIASGAIFVTGAVGMEMMGAHYYKPRWSEDWPYTICCTVEETLEMLGPALFIRTALRYAIEEQEEAAQGDSAS